MAALGRGDLEAAHVSVDIVPVKQLSQDELGEMGKKLQHSAGGSEGGGARPVRSAREDAALREGSCRRDTTEIAHLAHHDPLTGLPNRAVLPTRLAETLDRARADGSSFAVLSVDLDDFKEANDVFGHAVGDELLCAIALRLQAAAADAFVARVGGDEFTLVLATGEQPAGRARSRRASARGRWREDFEFAGQRIPIGLSIGAAIYPRDGSDTAACSRTPTPLCTGPRPTAAASSASSNPKWIGTSRSDMRCSTICGRRSPTTSCAALPAAGDGRRRGLRLRGAGALAASQTRHGPAGRRSFRWRNRTA